MLLPRSVAAPVFALGLCVACQQADVPPDGEAVVVVDTNLPVPGVISRLRIDVFTADGQWIASRDDVRPDDRDWPTSFSVYHDDPATESIALVRLRAYPQGRLIRYTGMIHASLPDLLKSIPVGEGQPRLLLNEQDQTPEFEPDPTVSVDRVVRLRLVYGQRGRVRVLLHGSCAGRMARLVPWDDVRSCVDGSDPLASVEEAQQDSDLSFALPSLAGTWGESPCDPSQQDLTSGRGCVPGGVFLLGDAFLRSSSSFGDQPPPSSRPERVVRLSRFQLDLDEVSVGSYRSVLAQGFQPPKPVGVYEKDGPPGADPSYGCTFSEVVRDRESYPLSCVPWVTARAYCRFLGGDLPTEAQWEYAAVAAGRAAKAIYPWGDDAPACDRAVYGRSYLYSDCLAQGPGIQPLLSTENGGALVGNHPLGLRNLAGSLGEHVLDTLLLYSNSCWTGSSGEDPLCTLPPRAGCPNDADPECKQDPAAVHGLRGGSWYSYPQELRSSLRTDQALETTENVLMGFRCAFPSP